MKAFSIFAVFSQKQTFNVIYKYPPSFLCLQKITHMV